MAEDDEVSEGTEGEQGEPSDGEDNPEKSVNKGTATKGGLLCPDSDSDSEEDFYCRGRRKRKKTKKAKPIVNWPAIPVQYKPCPHLHFKFDTVNRNALTKTQHLDLLATPRGYVWESEKELRYVKKGKRKGKRKRRRALKRADKKTSKKDKTYIGHFLCEIWNSLPTNMMDQLRKLLVEEFGMSEEEANEFIKKQKECAEKGEMKKVKNFCPDLKVGVRHKWVKDFSRVFATKVTDYVVMLLCCKRTPKIRKLAAAILKHFCDITGENTTLNTPKSKVQRLMVFIADRLAVWLDSLSKDTEADNKDVAVGASIERLESEIKPLEAKVEEEEEEEEEEASEEETVLPSKAPSLVESKPSSKEALEEESKQPSKPPSKEPSKEEVVEQAEPEAADEESVKEAPAEETLAEEIPIEEAEPEEDEPEAVDERQADEAEPEEVSEAEEMEETPEVVEVEEIEVEEEEVEEEEEEIEEEEVEEKEVESIISVESLPLIPPMALRDKGVVYQIIRGDGSFYNVRQLSSGTVADKVADVRKREKPIRQEKKVLTESPLKLDTMKDWANWAARAAAVAEEWTKWIDATVNTAEMKAKARKGEIISDDSKPIKLALTDWQEWQARTKLEVDEIARRRQDLKEEAAIWKKKTDKASERLGPETETKITDLSEENEEDEIPAGEPADGPPEDGLE